MGQKSAAEISVTHECTIVDIKSGTFKILRKQFGMQILARSNRVLDQVVDTVLSLFIFKRIW